MWVLWLLCVLLTLAHGQYHHPADQHANRPRIAPRVPQEAEATPTRTIIGGVGTVVSTSADLVQLLTTVFPSANDADRSSLVNLYNCYQTNQQFSQTSTDLTIGSTYINGTPTAGFPGMSTYYPNNYTYTLCDGAPRIGYSGGTPSSTTIFTTTQYLSGYLGTDATPGFHPLVTKAPLPCSLDSVAFAKSCDSIDAIWSKVRSLTNSAAVAHTKFTNLAYAQWNPFCDPAPPQPADPWCTLNVQSAHIYYWPNTAYDNLQPCQDAPASPPMTAAPANRSASTTVISGFTLTSPSVYIEYNGLSYASGTDGADRRTAATVWTKNVTFFGFAEDQVSSVCLTDYATRSYDFRDVQGEPPFSAWKCQQTNCDTFATHGALSRFCSTINTAMEPMAPVIAWPSTFMDVLKSLNPTNPDLCSFGWSGLGIMDPPQRLTAVGGLIDPVTNSALVLTPATPITSEPPATSPTLIIPAQTTTAGPAPDPAATPSIPLASVPNTLETAAGLGGASPATAVNTQPAAVPTAEPAQQPPQSPAPADSAPATPVSAPADSSATGIGAAILSALGGNPAISDGSDSGTTQDANGNGNAAPAPPAPVTAPAQGGATTAPADPGQQVTVPVGPPQAVVTAAATTFTIAQGSSGAAVIDGNTFSAGATLALPGGQIATIASNGVVVGGSREAFSPAPPAVVATGAAGTAGTAGAVNSGVFGTGPGVTGTVGAGTASTPSAVVIAGQTASVGGSAITIGTQHVSVGTAGVVIGGTSIIPFSAAATTSVVVAGQTVGFAPLLPAATGSIGSGHGGSGGGAQTTGTSGGSHGTGGTSTGSIGNGTEPYAGAASRSSARVALSLLGACIYTSFCFI